MKLSSLLGLTGISLIGFLGCSEPDGSTTEATTTPAATTTTPIAVPAQPATPQLQAGASSGAVNPPHGQPGHRCDIAVGAPLNSPPAAQQGSPQMIDMTPRNNAGATAPQLTVPVTTTPAQPQAGATGAVNPPHGQPGHRCDIAVGAPLN